MHRPAIAAMLALAAAAATAAAARPAAADEPQAATPPAPAPRLYFGRLDASSHEDFSATAAAMSDTLLVVGLSAPMILELGRADGDTDRRLLAYSGGVAASGLVAAAMKALWSRPRPYNFHPADQVRAYARGAGKDARYSFPSGHTALTFAAAAAGGWIYADGTTDTDRRAAVWGAGAAIAGATAVLRLRAGRHYPSDVVTGAFLGIAGVAVPAAVLGDVDLRPAEVAAMGGGLLLGAGIAAIVPFPRDVVTPIIVPGGAGVAVTGRLR